MSLDRTCARCASLLPDDAPEGSVCIDCAAVLESEQTMATPPDGSGSVSYRLPPQAPRAEVLGDFEIVEKLGQGGMGAVYRARQISLARVVALKVLPEYFAADEENVARFQREARIAAGLIHGNIVHVFSSGVIDGTHFIAMELVEGENLRQRMKRARLSISEALHICADVARGLEYGWEKAHLVHRDIKPGNIFLSHDGAVKVGDLGLAKSMSGVTSGLTQTGTSLGTALYMSPEQVRGDRTFDFRSDIYSLGCTLYEMLTGQPPYSGTDGMAVMRMHLDAPLPAILKAMPGCPIPLARLVGKMLKKNARERHPSYADLIAEIEMVREQIESGVTTTAPSKVVEAWKQVGDLETKPGATYGLLWAGLAALLVVGAGGAWWATRPEKPRPIASVPAKPIPTTTAPPPTAQSTVPGADALQNAGVVSPTGRSSFFPLPAAIEARAIKLWNKPETFTPQTGIRWLNNALRLEDKAIYNAGQTRDVVLRASVRVNPGSSATFVTRMPPDEVADKTMLRFTVDPQGSAHLRTTTAGRALAVWNLPRAYSGDEWIPVEVRTIGEECALLIDGKLVGTTREGTVRHAGRVLIYSGSADFRDISYIPLDGLPEAEVLKLAGVGATAEPWQDVLRDPAKLGLTGGGQRTPEGLRFATAGHALLPSGQGPQRDGAVRMKATFGGLSVQLRARQNDAAGLYQLFAREDVVVLERKDTVAKGGEMLRSFALRDRLQPGRDYELELRVVGQNFTAKLNGDLLGTVTDGTYATGQFGVGVTGESANPALIKTLAILNLDGLPEAEALKLVSAAAGSSNKSETFGGHRYQLVRESLNWTEAKAKAEQLGGHLATVTTHEENGFIRAKFLGALEHDEGFWIGGQANADGSYAWVTGEPFSVKGWLANRPNRLNIPAQSIRYWRTGAPETLGWDNIDSQASSSVVGFLVEWDTADASATPAPERWENLLLDPEMQAKLRKTAEGYIVSTPATVARGRSRDGAVRCRVRFDPADTWFRILAGKEETRWYQAAISSDERGARGGFIQYVDTTLATGKFAEASNQTKTPLSTPIQPGQFVDVELRVVGDTLRLSLNGEVVATARDTRLRLGRWGISGNGTLNNTLIQSLEYLDLSAPLPGASPKVAETTAAPTASAILPVGRWVPPYADWSKMPSVGEVKAGWALTRELDHHIRPPGAPELWQIRDGGLRVRYQIPAQWVGSQVLAVRNTRSQGEKPRIFQLSYRGPSPERSGGRMVIESYGGKTDAHVSLAEKKIPLAGTELTLEFIAVGKTLIGKINGETLTCTVDDAGDRAGGLTIFRTNGHAIRDLEVINLDGLPEADALKLVGAAPSSAYPSNLAPALRARLEAVPWKKLDLAAPPIPAYQSLASQAAAEYHDGQLWLKGGYYLLVARDAKDVAVRMKLAPGPNGGSIDLRANGGTRRLVIGVNQPKGMLRIDVSDGKTKTELVPGVSWSGDPMIEVFAIGDTIGLLADGQLNVATVPPDVSYAGNAQIYGDYGGSLRVESIEYKILNAPPPATAASLPPATATKDAPFVNSLGMKFVPVPITGGPTGGKRVLFSIWETRVQDYEAFVKDTQRQWVRPDGKEVRQPDTKEAHPATYVNRDDAVAFCMWLTERERAAGRLGAGEAYRLPSDFEWSCAAGIDDREDSTATPRDRHEKIAAFPWPGATPGGSPSANLLGEEADSDLRATGRNLLAGHRDDFPRLAPVGSFAATPLGLFDVSGNVAEWCLEDAGGTLPKGIMRGCSWNNGDSRAANLAYRSFPPSARRGDDTGFRVVLAPAE